MIVILFLKELNIPCLMFLFHLHCAFHNHLHYGQNFGLHPWLYNLQYFCENITITLISAFTHDPLNHLSSSSVETIFDGIRYQKNFDISI